MNNDSNNFNQDNYNAQGNNGMSNNQPLNNQSINQGAGINFQSTDLNKQSISIIQQPVMQESNNQTINSLDSGNTYNQNTNSEPPKKFNLGLVVGIVIVLLAVVVVFIIMFGKNSNSKKSDDKSEDVVTTEQYLDTSRNLKSEYEYKEIFDSFAVKLNDKKTYIIKPNKNYLVNLLQFSQGFVSRISGFYKTDNGTWGAYFNIITTNESTLAEVKKDIISSGYYSIVDESSNYVLSSNGQDYVFYTIVDETMIEVQISSTDDYFNKSGLSKDDILSIIKNIKTIVTDDDLKEPYLVDKIINVKINNNYKIKTYLMISDVNNDAMNDFNYRVELSNTEENGDYSLLDINYVPNKIINEYNLTNITNDSPRIYYDENTKSFISDENNNKQIFQINKYDIDGNNIEIKTYQDFVNNIKIFLNQY